MNGKNRQLISARPLSVNSKGDVPDSVQKQVAAISTLSDNILDEIDVKVADGCRVLVSVASHPRKFELDIRSAEAVAATLECNLGWIYIDNFLGAVAAIEAWANELQDEANDNKPNKLLKSNQQKKEKKRGPKKKENKENANFDYYGIAIDPTKERKWGEFELVRFVGGKCREMEPIKIPNILPVNLLKGFIESSDRALSRNDAIEIARQTQSSKIEGHSDNEVIKKYVRHALGKLRTAIRKRTGGQSRQNPIPILRKKRDWKMELRVGIIDRDEDGVRLITFREAEFGTPMKEELVVELKNFA